MTQQMFWAKAECYCHIVFKKVMVILEELKIQLGFQIISQFF